MGIQMAIVPSVMSLKMQLISFLTAPSPNLPGAVVENYSKSTRTPPLSRIYSLFSTFYWGASKCFLWMLFAAQSWALWTTRNKFSIEAKFSKHPANVVFKITIFLQLWRPLAKKKVHSMLDEAVAKLKDIYKKASQ
jgi:hypothetical protein